MLFILSLILIILPFLFQIIYGRKAIRGFIKWSFGMICVISFLLQIALPFLSSYIFGYHLEMNDPDRKSHCGATIIGFYFISIVLASFLLITMIIQYFMKRYYEKK